MLTSLKMGGIAALAALLFAGGFYFGSLRGDEKGDADKTAQEASQEAQSAAVAKAVLTERAAARAQAAIDHATETTHAQALETIDDLPPIATPLIVYRNAPKVRGGAVPSPQAEARSVAAGAVGGADQPVDRGCDIGPIDAQPVDIRPAVEALKKKLEKIAADYRQLDTEWPTQ
jgi:hypothetical protein